MGLLKIILSRVVAIFTVTMLMVALIAGPTSAELFPDGLFPDQSSSSSIAGSLGFGFGDTGLGALGGLLYGIGYILGYGLGQGFIAGISSSGQGAVLPV
jgi:hypothetical protein